MIAHHGLDLARIAEQKDTPLKYEAAVAGGIPVIKAIREGASANEIARVYGILNGTCNYILTQMERNGASASAKLRRRAMPRPTRVSTSTASTRRINCRSSPRSASAQGSISAR